MEYIKDRKKIGYKIMGLKQIKLIYMLKLAIGMLKKRDMHINMQNWLIRFLNLFDSEDGRRDEILNEFLTCEMEKISHKNVRRTNANSPILFCVIKNSVNKLDYFFEHYRKRGIEVFVFLDNNSTDGTKEYLLRQKDTIVFASSQEYSSARRIAWLNRLVGMYGENRWCLIVDSDELVDYIDSENYTFSNLIEQAKLKGIKRIEGFMLDMYSFHGLFSTGSEDTWYLNNIYFDKDSYELKNWMHGLVIRGGPRKRIFGRDMQLSKYPLFYFGQQDFIASSHYMIPNYPVKQTPVWLAIRHYKFTDEKDLEKVKEAVHKENYAGGSADYKVYMNKINEKGKLNFYDPNISTELVNSSSLNRIDFLRTPFKK